MEIHKEQKGQIDDVMNTYRIPLRDLSTWLKLNQQTQENEGKKTNETIFHCLNYNFKVKTKTIQRHEKKIA